MLKEIYSKFKLQFILLNVKSDSCSLKCGKSLPKPGGKIKEDFCSATLPLEAAEEFEYATGKNFKEAKIKHMLNIKEIEIPKEYLNDPAKARVNGIRKGMRSR